MLRGFDLPAIISTHSIQMKARMFYREIAAADPDGPVLNFWEFIGPDERGAIEMHEIPPDGCRSLYFYRNAVSGMENAGVTILHAETTVRPVAHGDRVWGARISPAACNALFCAGPDDAAEQATLSWLKDKLRDADSLEQAVPVFMMVISEMCRSRPAPDPKVGEAVRIIIANGGAVKIGELAAEVGLSSRQLQRRFKTAAGITPKKFARIRRIRESAKALLEDGSIKWADRAAEMGYADQAHLAHDFASLTRRPPGGFAKGLRKIKHGTIVK